MPYQGPRTSENAHVRMDYHEDACTERYAAIANSQEQTNAAIANLATALETASKARNASISKVYGLLWKVAFAVIGVLACWVIALLVYIWQSTVGA